ncbi:hypothetical protein [Butyricicoccus pullicaecorum]|uniref:hypothetical protein n=1 Tax=Butyricicoccus pullicaecorum TaxID=501571 RepID=UPI0035209A2C
MGFFAQCAVGMLAAAGLICILKTVYDIIFHSTVCVRGKAELYLYLDPDSAEAEQLLRQIDQAKRTFLPGLTVIWVDTGTTYEDFSCSGTQSKQDWKGNRQRAGTANNLWHGHADRVSKY